MNNLIENLEDTISLLNIRLSLISIAVRLGLGEKVYKHILEASEDRLLEISDMFLDLFREAKLLKENKED